MSLLTDLNPFARKRPVDAIDDAVAGARGGARRLWRQGRSLALNGGTKPSGTSVAGAVGGAVAGVVVLGAGAILAQWLRERSEPQPTFDTLREDGAISLRRYRAMTVATAGTEGAMADAMSIGFRRLFNYIRGKTRAGGGGAGEAIAMTTPVIAAPSDHPGAWLIRFVMPNGATPTSLPAPAAGVELEQLPGRLVAAIRFPGRLNNRMRSGGEVDALRSWIAAQGFETASEPTFAAYNSPMIPGPLRHNEWWIEVAEPVR